MRAAALAAVAAGAALAGCVGVGPSGEVEDWVAETYAPAVRAVHDPTLGPWRTPPATGAALREGCAAALGRHDEWAARLRAAPERSVRERVATWADAERAALTSCAAGGPAPARDLRAPVDARLREMGVAVP